MAPKPILNSAASTFMMPPATQPTTAVAGTKRKAADKGPTSQRTAKGVTTEKPKDNPAKRKKSIHHNAKNVPANVPMAAFSPIPAPAITPWPHDFAAPTPTYDQKIACPVNWSTIADPKCNADAIKAYELRAPWNDPPVRFKVVAEAVSISEEGVRKRFRKANLAVFEATGVYFRKSTLGLDAHDIPDAAELEDILKGITRKINKALKSAAELSTKATRKALSYDGVPVSLVIRPPGQTGGISRLVTEEVMRQLRITNRDIIRCSVATFDRWYSCLSIGLRHSFPKRVYRLEPLLNSYTHTDFGTPPTAIGDYFETYVLSQRMGTTAVSDMILDELIQALRDEETLLAKYRSGEFTMQSNVDVVRFLNFEPEDINMLWKKTKTDDPIRELILDILWYKAHAAEEKIEGESEDLVPVFLAAWNARKAQPVDPIRFFVDGTNVNGFCVHYHNHGEAENCYRSKPESSSVVPDGASLLQTQGQPLLSHTELEEFNEEDAYETPWVVAKKDNIPEGAHKIREDKDTGEVTFEIEDEHWYPPADWEPDEMQQLNQSFAEFQEYRKWLWLEMGGTIPRITVKRFRPYERDFVGWRDPLQDARTRRLAR